MDRDDNYYGCDDDTGTQDNCSAALTDNDFSFKGTTYTVKGLFIFVVGGVTQLHLDLDKAVPSGTLVLRLGTTSVSTASASVQGTTGSVTNGRWFWDPSDVSWSDNQQVSVSLVEPPPPPTPTVNLSVSPNPMKEAGSATLEVRLSWALSSAVTIPLTVTAGSAESGDYVAIYSSATFPAGTLVRTGSFLFANTDADTDDETLTVAVGALPSSVVAGGMSSVQVTILDKDFTTPAPAGLRVTPGDRRLTLRWTAPAPLEDGDSITVFGYEAAYRCGGGWIDHGEQLTRSDGRFNDPLSLQTTRVMDGLVPGAAYEVRVRASVSYFRARGGTVDTRLSDWVYGTGTPSGAGGSTSCGDTNARLRNLEMNTGN